MKQFNCVGIFAFMLVAWNCWAYGGGSSSSTKACAKPKFTDFVPAENAEVKAGSSFSFVASKNSYPNTIKITVKDQAVVAKVTPKSDGSFQVSGVLPASLQGPYARIAINSDAQSNCKGSGGWLVKIAK